MNNSSTHRDRRRVLAISVLAGLAIIPIALVVGPAHIGFHQVFALLSGHADAQTQTILCDIRLPRMALAFLVGMALAVSGTVFQGLLMNPLAGPYTLGISSGAAFGASIAIFFGLTTWLFPFAALLGAGISLGTVLALSRARGGLDPRSLILAGIVIGSIFSAAISLVKSLSGESLSAIVFWIMGSLSGRGWTDIGACLPYLLIGLTGIVIWSRDLDLLCMGDDHAHSAGVDVVATRRLLLFFASLTAAAAVSVSGVIGFVGLVVPHAVRMLAGPAHRPLALLSALAGGVLMLYADTLARALSYAGDIPVGVITALLGGPFFCILLAKGQSLQRT